jgi:hypothetical protein
VNLFTPRGGKDAPRERRILHFGKKYSTGTPAPAKETRVPGAPFIRLSRPRNGVLKFHTFQGPPAVPDPSTRQPPAARRQCRTAQQTSSPGRFDADLPGSRPEFTR